jgi:hypothetical protein
MRITFTLVFVFISGLILAQTDPAKARKLYEEGIKLMEEGKFNESSAKILEAKKFDLNNWDLRYVEAYLFYKKKQYPEAIANLEAMVKSGNAISNSYKLLGNCYELKGDKLKAIETYRLGLKAFPNSGEMLMEMGLVEMFNKNYKIALEYFEKGIKTDPTYPSNYYWAAKLYNQSSEKVWVIVYGEMFMNIERNTDRTIDMGMLLYDLYKESFTKKPDTAQYLQLTQMWLKPESKSGSLIKPKAKRTFEQAFTESMSQSTIRKDFNLGVLANYRNNFLTEWFNGSQPKDFPNVLFNYLKKMKDEGKFEMYNYWLFQEGDQEFMAKWYEKNQAKFNDFLAWFSDNPMKVDNENKVYRLQYWK